MWQFVPVVLIGVVSGIYIWDEPMRKASEIAKQERKMELEKKMKEQEASSPKA